MAQGPGAYDPMLTVAREESGAETAILIVLNGKHGSGFSMQTIDPEQHLRLPSILRRVADDIERDLDLDFLEGRCNERDS